MSACILFIYIHISKTWSKTQATIALGSGEAELAAVVRAAAEGLLPFRKERPVMKMLCFYRFFFINIYINVYLYRNLYRKTY